MLLKGGTTVYSGNQTSWNGKVGLMYLSDYLYTYAYGVDDTCYNDGDNCDTGTPSSGWLHNSTHQWTLFQYSSNSVGVSRVSSAGRVYSASHVANSYGVRPALHLRADISLSGSGTASDPYVIVN